MKKLAVFVVFFICFGIVLNFTSCMVFVKKDNGLHKGWFKNSHNPHHPSTTNPGKSKGHGKK